MAKAKATAQTSSDKQSGIGRKLLIILLALILVALLAAGGLLALLLLNQGDDASDNGTETQSVNLSSPPTFHELEPFVVNLRREDGERSGRFLQAKIALRASSPETAEQLDGYMPEIRHRINMLLSAKSPSELSDREGREALAEEITAEVNQVLGVPPDALDRPDVPIQSVLFNSFIIQ